MFGDKITVRESPKPLDVRERIKGVDALMCYIIGMKKHQSLDNDEFQIDSQKT